MDLGSIHEHERRGDAPRYTDIQGAVHVLSEVTRGR
jgi:hypothetical protein